MEAEKSQDLQWTSWRSAELMKIQEELMFQFKSEAAEETPALTIADEKPKEGVKSENNDHINLKVAGQDGSVVHFKMKMKRHTQLNKLMKAYTPAQLEMEDEDTFDVFQHQTGGVY
ncbi:small ubiquitin-related modifier 2-like [Sciurus carolinensis]|uniref:small ubiquitin-related modifier 2-like n=1 Tax=Sciurus carolinensis TaxID=30640 RepID=UPI001FB38ED1|nr:small ubiquitin-related modifier 2-like [Sciurus carolinensis]